MARYIRRRVEIFLEEYGKISSIKTRRNRLVERNQALVRYRTVEEANTALADINMYQGWRVETYRTTSKNEQNKVKEGYRVKRNNRMERNK